MSARRKTLLQQRIDELGIPPCPAGVCLFERVLVYRIPDAEAESERYGDGPIVKSDERRTTDKHRSPRGVIVSAGLKALDIMKANGMMLGDVIWISPDVFTRFEVGMMDGRSVEFAFMNIGDAITDEDLATRLFHHAEGEEPEMAIEYDRAKHEHVITSGGLPVGPRVEPTHNPGEV